MCTSWGDSRDERVWAKAPDFSHSVQRCAHGMYMPDYPVSEFAMSARARTSSIRA